MPEFVDGTIAEIDRRLAELGEEEGKLRAARAVLLGAGGSTLRRAARRAAPAKRAAAPRGRARGRRAGAGTRADQAVAVIRANPGITVPQLAGKLKIQPNYLYRVVPKLVSDGLITKNGTALSAIADAK